MRAAALPASGAGRHDRPMRRDGTKAWVALAALAQGCASAAGPEPAPAVGAGETLTIFEAGDALERDWRVMRVWRRAEFALAPLGERVAIRIAAAGASGGLGRYVEIDVESCPAVEWTWRVDSLPEGADLSSVEAEDVAASLMFFFGDPGSLALPKPVPTLRYVWAASEPVGAVIDSPNFSGTLRSLVVRSGPDALGRAVAERRDLAADYRTAFGEAPPGPVALVALFTDSDHGGRPVEAFYLDARAFCDGPTGEGLPLI